MRKLTLMAVWALASLGLNAQELNFVHEGKVLENGATVRVEAMKELGGGYGNIDAEVFVQNAGATDVEASLKIEVTEGETIGFCHFMESTGTCMAVAAGKSLTRTRTMKAGETHDPEVHSMMSYKLDNATLKFQSTVVYTLTYGSTSKSVTVELDYDAATSITASNVKPELFVAGQELRYNFDKAADRWLNIYSITGSLVKRLPLETAGSVSLSNLNKGVYLYEVVENGQRVAAHKCVLR